MAGTDLPRRLRSLDLFAGLSDAQLEPAARLAEERRVSPGTTLAGEGAHGYFFFVIESGTAEVRHGGQVVRQLGPGDFFGEIAILEPGRRRTASVVASCEMKVLAFFGTDYHALAAAAPEVATRVRAVIAERLAATR